MHGSPEQLCSLCRDGCDAKVTPSSRIPLDRAETDSSFPAKTIDWLPADQNQWPALLVHQGLNEHAGKPVAGPVRPMSAAGCGSIPTFLSSTLLPGRPGAPSRWTLDRRRKNQSRQGSQVLLPSLAILRFLLSPAIGHCARLHRTQCGRASAYGLSALRQSLAQTSTLTIPDRVCVGDEHSDEHSLG